MTSFADLKKEFYGRVPIGPLEGTPTRTGTRSDIVSHLPVLEHFASQCEHVTEFGVREGCSTVALLSGSKGVVHSYDIVTPEAKVILESMELSSKWVFHLGDTGSNETFVEDTELLFIDTLHTRAHVAKELLHHGRKATKFLAFHDTYTCGEFDRSGPVANAEGILPAIADFLAMHPGEYETAYRTDVNNGLWILKRI
jgi:hypothetical protein